MAARLCKCGCGVALPEGASARREYLDTTHRGRAHSRRLEQDQGTVEVPDVSSVDVTLDAATRARLVKAKRLGSTDGRLAVLAARRVEAATDASDAAFVALMREYRVAMDAALVGVVATADAVESEPDAASGGDHGSQSERGVGRSGSTLTLVPAAAGGAVS